MLWTRSSGSSVPRLPDGRATSYCHSRPESGFPGNRGRANVPTNDEPNSNGTTKSKAPRLLLWTKSSTAALHGKERSSTWRSLLAPAHVDGSHLSGGKRASGEMPAGDCASRRPDAISFPGHVDPQRWPRSPPGAERVESHLGGEIVVISVGLLAVHLMPPMPGIGSSHPPPVPERPMKGFRKIS